MFLSCDLAGDCSDWLVLEELHDPKARNYRLKERIQMKCCTESFCEQSVSIVLNLVGKTETAYGYLLQSIVRSFNNQGLY